MLLHSDPRVVGLSTGGSQQDQPRLKPSGLMEFFDQSPSDPLALPLAIDSQIGQVGAVGEIGNRTSDPQQRTLGMPRGRD